MSAPKVLLETSDKETFSVDREVTERSVMLKNMLEGQSSPFSSWPAGTHLFAPRSSSSLLCLRLSLPSQMLETRPSRPSLSPT